MLINLLVKQILPNVNSLLVLSRIVPTRLVNVLNKLKLIVIPVIVIRLLLFVVPKPPLHVLILQMNLLVQLLMLLL